MRTEVFKNEHLKMINPIGGFGDETIRRQLSYNSVTALTAFDGEKVISICGVWVLWDGVGEAFTIMDKDVSSHAIALYKAYRTSLKTVMAALKLFRIQATVIVGHDAGVRFIESLGFTREGVMRKWSPTGDDVYMYSIVGGGPWEN